jgi:RAT1-interacting protein
MRFNLLLLVIDKFWKVTWRGIITKILCTPYTKEPFELGVTMHNDTIYIEEHETEFKRAQNQNQDDRGRLMSFWGYRFESLSTVSSFPSKTDPIATRLGNTSIVMGAEVDCTSGKQTL